MSFETELSTTKDLAIKQIGDYLRQRAETDPSVAANLKKEKKSLAECWKYIMGEAFAKAKRNGSTRNSYLTDNEVYGMAIHYYDEDNIKINPLNGVKSTKTEASKETSESEVKKKVEKRAKQNKKKNDLIEGQMSLFEF